MFNNPKFGELRTSTDANGKTFFCLNDLCRALELKNVGETKKRLKSWGIISNYVSSEIISHSKNTGISKEQEMLFIDEPNLYRCIFQSRKKEASEFQDWVFEEVLPSIRKQGGYIVEKQDDTPEAIMARALQVANNVLAKRERQIRELEVKNETQQVRIEEQTKQLTQSAPKVQYYDEVLQSTTTMTMTQIAKGLGMEAHALNMKLNSLGILFKQSGQWMLRAPYSNWKMNGVRVFQYVGSNGDTVTKTSTVYNERGRRFITALFNNGWNVKQAIAAINGKEAQA